MADTLVERLTGQTDAEEVAVEVQVVITDEALFGSDETPGQVPGYGTVPAGWVRDLLTPHHDHNIDSDDADTGHAATTSPRQADTGAPSARSSAALREHARVWVRRLYAHPTTGALVAMDSTRRVFHGGLRKYLLTRDAGTCRTPWCDAPIRHLDHVTDHAAGGPTTATNGQGLCVRCNHTKQLPGFTARTITPALRQPETPHTVELTTPTDHTYRSTAPPLIPGAAPRHQQPTDHEHPANPPLSPFERYLTDLIAG